MKGLQPRVEKMRVRPGVNRPASVYRNRFIAYCSSAPVISWALIFVIVVILS